MPSWTVTPDSILVEFTAEGALLVLDTPSRSYQVQPHPGPGHDLTVVLHRDRSSVTPAMGTVSIDVVLPPEAERVTVTLIKDFAWGPDAIVFTRS